MNIPIKWDSEFIAPIVLIIIFTISYSTYYFLSQSKTIKKKITAKWKNQSEEAGLIFIRITGALLIGLIPALILLPMLSFNIGDYGLNLNLAKPTFLWMLTLAPLIVIFSYFTTKANDIHGFYPQIRREIWNGRLFLLNAVIWGIYLFAYEFMFRGVMLQVFGSTFDAWTAITISTSIYALVHIPKGAKEVIGSIPFGVLLCVVTLVTGNIWAAVFSHTFLGISNDYFCIKNNPNMRFLNKKKETVK